MSYPGNKKGEEEHDVGSNGGGIDSVTVHALPYLGEVCRIREQMQDEQVCLTEFEFARTDIII
jgi:hypothetical protein